MLGLHMTSEVICSKIRAGVLLALYGRIKSISFTHHSLSTLGILICYLQMLAEASDNAVIFVLLNFDKPPKVFTEEVLVDY